MNTWKKNLEETKQHYIDWWNHKGIVLNMWEHFQNGVEPHADIPAPPEPYSLHQKWFDPQWRAEYLDWYVAHSSLKADMLPVANTQLGPGSLAAILGGVFEGGPDTIWIHPNPDFKDDFDFDPEHPNWLLHKELLKAVKAKAQGNYYVGMPDLMEGLDVLAAMKGTDKILLDTVMQPDILELQVQQINEIYFRVFDELYDIIREGDEMAFCYFSSWAPGKMTKLQCDISTMIGVEDYRRFVQPFIREQCRKIDYTLYHLDGVGALHHLPALLEVDELNAIQWTPGVGEPQGGSPKWYDLYRRILDAGKSVMACWVTLDELRPLLDNIGGDGVHLEMDFHNEDEVEEAMKIVEEYRGRPAIRHEEPEASISLSHSDNQLFDFNSFDSDKVDSDNHIFDSDTLDPDTLGSDSHFLDSDNFDPDKEVERIIEKVESESVSTPEIIAINPEAPIVKAFDDHILVLDGAMGTMIQTYGLSENDFRGELFASHPSSLKGNNDLLSLTRPDVIHDIHRRYLDAGADIITTNTFNAQAISMADFHMEEHCRAINLAACAIARELADEYTRIDPARPRFVVGAMGPTPKTCSITSGIVQPGWVTFSYDILLRAYTEQAKALIDGKVDAILIETIFDVKNAEAAVNAAVAAMRQTGKTVPLMLSFTISDSEGRNMLGQSIEDFISSLNDAPILSVGVNCIPDAGKVTSFIGHLGEKYPYRISLYPNAGLPDFSGSYDMTPEKLRESMWPLLEGHLLNMAGGCCGTTDAHIHLLAQAVQPFSGLYLSPHKPGSKADIRETKPRPKPRIQECECCTPATQAAPQPSVADGVFDAILAGKADDAAAATQASVDAGISPQEIINGQMIRAMGEVGQLFQDGKAFVPQLLMAGRAMKAGLELLKPLMAGEASTSIGKVLIGTVKGDLHDIGKNLVASMLEGCGFEVINIGIDVPAEAFVDEIRKSNPDILCMSALLTTTMTYMKDVIDAVTAAGLRDKVKIMVGGAPVTLAFAEEIGADGYSDNANTAVALARRLVGAL